MLTPLATDIVKTAKWVVRVWKIKADITDFLVTEVALEASLYKSALQKTELKLKNDSTFQFSHFNLQVTIASGHTCLIEKPFVHRLFISLAVLCLHKRDDTPLKFCVVGG